jgi:hypothetical protein
MGDGKGMVMLVDGVLLDGLCECDGFLCFLCLEWCCEWWITCITCVGSWLGGYCVCECMGDGGGI